MAQTGAGSGVKPVSLGPEGRILSNLGRPWRSQIPGGRPTRAGWSLGPKLSGRRLSCRETGSGGHSDGHAVGNPVWGQIVIRQLLVLVALGDHPDDGIKVFAELGHGLLYRPLDEMLLWVHAQEQLRAQTWTDRLICDKVMQTALSYPRAHPLLGEEVSMYSSPHLHALTPAEPQTLLGRPYGCMGKELFCRRVAVRICGRAGECGGHWWFQLCGCALLPACPVQRPYLPSWAPGGRDLEASTGLLFSSRGQHRTAKEALLGCAHLHTHIDVCFIAF